MAEWATLKNEKISSRFSGTVGGFLLLSFLGCLIARSNIMGIYPFAIAYLAVLALDKERKTLPGLIGIIIGTISVGDVALFTRVMIGGLLCILIISRFKDYKVKIFLLPFFTALFSVLPLILNLVIGPGISEEAIIELIALGALAAGFSLIFLYAFSNLEVLMKGSFNAEQGLVWVLILAVCLSGLQNISIGLINLQIAFLCFFLLYIADRFGAGSGAGAGVVLGFLLHWEFGLVNLINAGIYGLLGFACGGFRKFGKLGLALTFSAVVLIMAYFVNEGSIYSYLYSSGLGLIMFLILPGGKKQKITVKTKAMPEVETTVNKVKTLAQIFDQLALGFEAAGLDSGIKPEVPEMMNILVERICKDCSIAKNCWQRDFYRTYNFMFDLFAFLEKELEVASGSEPEELPAEWKMYCGRLQELMLAARFILEQQKDREVWQKRLALNRDAVVEQYRNVSEIIGHLASELHSQHNIEQGKPLVWSRHYRQFIDIGVGTFIKSGNGISGDNFTSVPLSPSNIALIVCDGMGVGEEAARMSSTALTILEQLLSTGFEPERAVKALNSILVLRSPEESFVTVDMAIINTDTEEVRLIKIGAAPSYLLNGDQVESFETSSLPAGILNDIDIPVIDINIKDKTLIMVTDGVLDVVNKKRDWLKEHLRQIKNLSVQELADNIIEEIASQTGQYFEDDGVILVLRKK
ncbi:MAG: SpoIIE family protein phosphatase [Desulfitobacteriia bacterium]|jgi:stage II sporulation protein E